jgi:hypothetical protein
VVTENFQAGTLTKDGKCLFFKKTTQKVQKKIAWRPIMPNRMNRNITEYNIPLQRMQFYFKCISSEFSLVWC